MSTAKTMHAWRKHTSSTEPIWESVPVPTCPARGYLVRMIASGVCHSDHSLLNVSAPLPNFNDEYTLGHEGCGEIIEVGADVAHEEYRKGDSVALLSFPGCGDSDCPECSRDLAQLCSRGLHHGLGQDGFYAPYVAVDIRAVARVPEGVSPQVAAVATDAVLTAYHGIVRRAEVKEEETVFLFGLGGLGFNALQILHKSIGARVIVSDVRDERLEEAVRLGVPKADVVPTGKSVQEWVNENGLSGKIDTVLDFVGMKQTFQDGQMIVRPGGKVLCVGALHEEIPVQTKLGIRKRLSLIFTFGGQHGDLVECLDLIAKGVVTPQVETAKLEDFPRVLQDLCDGKIKARMALMHEAKSG